MKENIIHLKSYAFALRIIDINRLLIKKKEFVLSKQLLRSGTAIGALIKESEFAQSKADFIHKMSIVLKEANETEYWLQLLNDSRWINKEEFLNIQPAIREIIAILVKILKTSKTNN